ncbi:MAG TPA: alkaline phosphatase family protein [Terriglobia bacterium]|nr:alkaline phosphatase family protein [Terriglobia bacterium]
MNSTAEVTVTKTSAGLLVLILAGLSVTPVGPWAPRTMSRNTAQTVGPLSTSDVQVNHVFIVLLENHNYSSVIGNASMPYLNSLATTYAYAQNYFANTHPSIGNYFMLTAGEIITNDDNFGATVTKDNIVRHLIGAGKTWKEYSEGLPSVGYIGRNQGDYTQHHNPLSYFSDVRQSTSERQNLVPFTQFATDLNNHTLPNYSFIVPDNDHDGHDCPDNNPNCTDNQNLANVDSWLQTNLQPLIQSSDFSTPGGGLLVIVFDESLTDNNHGGGKVAWVAVGPNVKPGFISSNPYQHQSTLRFMSEAIGLTTFPGLAATAPDMEEFISGD